MQKLKVIKSYQVLTNSLEKEADLSFDSDRAVTDFVAFAAVGGLHASRVDNALALDVLDEVIDKLKNTLLERRNVISLT